MRTILIIPKERSVLFTDTLKIKINLFHSITELPLFNIKESLRKPKQSSHPLEDPQSFKEHF